MKFNWTIKQKLTGLFVLVGLIPLILLAGLSINRIRTEFRKNALKDLSSVQAEKQEQLQDLFRSNQEDLNDLVARVSRAKQERLESLKIIQDLKQEQVQAYFNHLETNLNQLVKNEAVQAPLLDGFGPTDPGRGDLDQSGGVDYNRFLRDFNFLSLVWIDTDGTVRQSVGSILTPGMILSKDDPRQADLLLAKQQATADPGRLIVVESDLDDSKQNSSSFLTAAAVVNSRGEILGVLAADVPYQDLDQLIRDRTGLGKTGESYLVSKNEVDQVILRSTPFFVGTGQYHPGSVLADLAGAYDRSASSGQSGSGLYLDGEKQLTLAVFEPLDLPWVEWSLVTSIQADEVYLSGTVDGISDPFQDLLNEGGYGNVYLISKFGAVFYTAVPEPTLGTNLIGGPYSRTNLASLFRSVHVNTEPGFADFYPYSPLGDLPAAFLAAPVLSTSQQVDLVVALQITNSEINKILQTRAGLGDSGEIYLTGQDHYLRSDSFLAPEMFSMVKSFSGELATMPIPEEIIEDVLAGETGMGVYQLKNGKQIFSTYSPIRVFRSSWGMITQKDAAEVYSSANDLMWILLGASGVVLLLVLILGISFGNQVSSPLTLLTRTAQPLSGGDLQLSDKEQLGLEKLQQRTDEFGELASSFSNLIDYLQSLAARAVEIAGGDLRNDVQPRSGRDQLGTAFSDMTTQLRDVLGQISAYSASVNLSADQLAAAAGETRHASDQISDSIQEINLGLQAQAKNLDLTRNSIQQMIIAVDGVAVGAQDQAHAAGQSADITNQINAAITNVAEIAQLGAAESAQASQKAREGTAAVDKNLKIMDEIQAQVAASVEKVLQMGHSYREIDQIVVAIETIASETNLLALNAAIEAARAGEHGKGFAVVADEVRKLADESKTATARISGILGSIEAAIQEAVQSMEHSAAEVSRGVDSSRDTGQALEEIIRAAERVSEQVEMIAATAEELNASGNQLVVSHQTVTAVIEENSAATEEISAGSEDVSTAINEIVKVSEGSADSAGEVSQSVSGLRSQVADVMIASLGLHQLAIDLNQVMDGFQLGKDSGVEMLQSADPELADPQEKMINGSGILYRKNYVLDKFGDREWSLVLDSLPVDTRAVLEQPINPSLKYPQRVYSELIDAIRNQLGNGNPDQFNREMAAYVAQAEVTGIYQPIMEANTPLEMLSKLPVLWQIQVPEGRMTCRVIADREVEISFNHQVDRELCQNSLVGYISGLLEIFEVRNPSVSHTNCIYKGDDAEVYWVRWDE